VYAVSPVMLAAALFCAGAAAAATDSQDQPHISAAQMIRRSVIVNTGDWQAQPEYAFREHDTKSKIDGNAQAHVEDSKTYEVSMIEGSPYNRLIAINNEPLSKDREHAEQIKFERETHRRQRESSGDRNARISKYQSERREEHMLMQQMTEAFTFTVTGTERVGGVDCYVLNASPNPNYRPPVEKTRVLTGMKGRLWIDRAHYHWVKVQAEVISPVEFALFIAKVKPGTRFELEQAPVGNVWLPKCFTQTVNATVLGFYGMRTREEEHYSDYRLMAVGAEAPATK
jgi:hypothetical protein